MDEIANRVKVLSDVYYALLAKAKKSMNPEELFRVAMLNFALGTFREACTPSFAMALVRKEEKPTAILEFCERFTEFIQTDDLRAFAE